MILRKIKTLFLYIFNLILWLAAKTVPKDENIWIFGAWYGKKYADNSKYLFEYISQNHPEIRAVWLTDDIEIIKQLSASGFEVYKRYSFIAILIGFRAEYSVFVHGNASDSMVFLNKNAKLIQLWHGIPLKKVGDDDNIKSNYSYRKFINYLFFLYKERYDLMISCSEEDMKKFSIAFQTKKISILGYPRNDALFRNNKVAKQFQITYLPTFRDNVGDKIDLFSDYNFDIQKWNRSLSEKNIVFNIKMHPVNKPKDELLEKFINVDNMNFLNEIDVADVLADTDILITDYSSVYFDYLLTNRPIIFTPFDYEKYITKDRELYYDYNEVTPGPKCKNWNEVLDWILKFKENPKLYKEEREKVKNRFHKYQDGKSCQRVYEEIIKFL